MTTFIATSGAESWTIVALNEYQAGVKLRALLRLEGRMMPVDLVWTAQ